MLVWGYGWEGTYADSVFMGNPSNWNMYPNVHMLMLRWIDSNYDGLVQSSEIYVEQYSQNNCIHVTRSVSASFSFFDDKPLVSDQSM
jgi:hypothetical protein